MSTETRNQYRITVNSTQSTILDIYPDAQWTRIAEVSESRGGIRASLERRLITGSNILALIPDALSRGYIQVDDDTVVCPWEVIAELIA